MAITYPKKRKEKVHAEVRGVEELFGNTQSRKENNGNGVQGVEIQISDSNEPQLVTPK